jgi:hypothetical protein
MEGIPLVFQSNNIRFLPLLPRAMTAEIHLLLEGINVHHATYHAHYHRPPETTP